MTEREKCYEIIDSFKDDQLSSIAVLLTTAKALADEAEDDAYCRQLYAPHIEDDDEGEDIESVALRLGVDL